MVGLMKEMVKEDYHMHISPIPYYQLIIISAILTPSPLCWPVTGTDCGRGVYALAYSALDRLGDVSSNYKNTEITNIDNLS